MMTLDAIKDSLSQYRDHTPEYQDRMIHDVPDTAVIDRRAFILEKCMDKIVLDIGCSGPLHLEIQKVAKKTYGLDKVKCDVPNFFEIDIDALGKEWFMSLSKENFDIIICGEVVEHLSNPGLFLEGLYSFKCPKIFTVPNAFGGFSAHWIKQNKENVNKEHVAYYTYTTFSTLLKRYNYKIDEFYWYDNPSQVQRQGFNEGLVFLTT
jgi:hypothetical protein